MKTNLISWNLTLTLLILFLSSQSHVSFGTDTISANQSLSGDQTLVSREGEFELGFFEPGKNSSRFYIGIWYKKVSERTVVWVANRETPVKDKNTASLTFQDGNLVLLDESQNTVWSTNVTTSGPVAVVLLNDGNLVVLSQGSLNSTSNLPIWQSFDNPTHTWLPGGKLAYNKVSQKAQILTSWKNSDDPAPGLFSLELDPEGKQYVIKWNRSRQYWTSGPWNEQSKLFSLVPEMKLNYIYNFSYVDNANESYFTYSVYDPAFISRFVMDVSGQIKQLSWLTNTRQWNLFWTQPRQQCEVYAYCGEFGICNENSLPFCHCLQGFEPKSAEDWSLNDFSGGCGRRANLQCGNNGTRVKPDKFQVYAGTRLLNDSESVAVVSASECESRCLGNCSCTAYTYDSNGCSLWSEELLNLQQISADDSGGKTIYIRLSASEFSSGKKNSAMVIGGAVGSVVLVLVLLGVILFVVRRRRRRMVGAGKSAEGSLVAFGYRDLQNATKNFSEKLGVGAFGSVFKGKLSDSSVIAVKKLESVSQGEKQFRAEVSTIGTIQHVNLVRLRGFCSEGSKKLLVYEYLENRSLDAHIFHEDESKILNWKIRYQIALGTARGLAYLHEKCREVIIHCDIKPENILLDAEFCPKVADFGLAKLMGRDFSRVLTTMRGTRGYLAPEWISGLAITAKADVYSYGMMLFEFISGRRNSESSTDGVMRFFPSWAAQVLIDEGDILSLLDPKLDRQADLAEVLRLCKAACWCIQDNESHRPSMGQVVQILEGVLDVNLPPLPRALQTFFSSQDHVVFFTDSSSNQSSEPQSKTSSSSVKSTSTGS